MDGMGWDIVMMRGRVERGGFVVVITVSSYQSVSQWDHN